MASAVNPPVSSQTFRSLYWDRSDDSWSNTFYKVFVVARETLFLSATVGLFIFNPTLFAPFFFTGILLRDQLDLAFDHMYRIYKAYPITTITILALGAILAFPASGWIACALVALWAGKRVADLGHIATSG